MDFIIALIIAVAVILFPAAFVWYFNISGLYAAVRAKIKKATQERENT